MPRTPSRRVAGPRPGAAAIGTTVFLLFLALIETFGWGADGNRFINRAGTNVTVPIGGARVLMYSGELRGWVPIAEVP